MNKKFQVTFKMNGHSQVETFEAKSKDDAETIIAYAFSTATNIVAREVK